MITDSGLFHELQVTRAAEFSGRPTNYELQLLSGGGQEVILSQPNQKWESPSQAAPLQSPYVRPWSGQDREGEHGDDIRHAGHNQGEEGTGLRS